LLILEIEKPWTQLAGDNLGKPPIALPTFKTHFSKETPYGRK
jgi:hypothetical protein